MKVKYLKFYGVSLFFLLSSCSPIFVKYVFVSTDINSVGKLENSDRPVLVECDITQGHYPDKKVQNFIKISLQNFSKDTVFFNKTDFLKVTTRVNIIDTLQLKSLLSNDFKNFLLPQKQIIINHNYWSNTFNGSIKKLVNVLIDEETVIQVRYTTEKDLFENYILLKPNLKRFKK